MKFDKSHQRTGDKMGKIAVISLWTLALIASGCSSSPPESMVADYLNETGSSTAVGLRAPHFKVVSIKKLDGQAATVFGVNQYTMRIEAIIECSEFFWACADAAKSPDHRTKYLGTAHFEESEQGWRIVKLEQNSSK